MRAPLVTCWLACSVGCVGTDNAASDFVVVTEADVRAIRVVSLGAAFAGDWTLDATVTRTTCGGQDATGILGLPKRGQVVRLELFVDGEGGLTRVVSEDERGPEVERARLDSTGNFRLGFYLDTFNGTRRIEVVSGRLTADGAVTGGASRRRDVSVTFDCVTELEVSGARAATGD